MSKAHRKAAIEGNLFQKWRRELTEINAEVARSMSRTRQWNELARTFVENPSIQVAQEFFPWVRKMYWDSSALFVRQQALDAYRGSISLIRLLRCISEQPHVVSRERVLGEHDLFPGVSMSSPDPEMRRLAEESVARLLADDANKTIDGWAGAGGMHIRPAAVAKDMAKLKKSAGPAILFASKLVAHKEPKKLSMNVSGHDIDRAVNLTRRLTIKYSDILCVPCGLRQQSTRQFNYDAIFRRQWIAPSWKRVWRGGERLMERRSELWPSPDQLSWGDYMRIMRRKKQIIDELGSRRRRWRGPSPVRNWLDSQALPSCDAAIVLVRDLIAQAPHE